MSHAPPCAKRSKSSPPPGLSDKSPGAGPSSTSPARWDADQYYLENEHFHHIIYKSAGNEFLEREALKLHRRLKPFRRIQLHLRGRMKQSMDEHREIVKALTDADSTRAADTLRDHVAIQGEKFNHLMTSLKDKSI